MSPTGTDHHIGQSPIYESDPREQSNQKQPFACEGAGVLSADDVRWMGHYASGTQMTFYRDTLAKVRALCTSHETLRASLTDCRARLAASDEEVARYARIHDASVREFADLRARLEKAEAALVVITAERDAARKYHTQEFEARLDAQQRAALSPAAEQEGRS